MASDAAPTATATIRTQVSAPPRFTGGYATAARVFRFDGLVDGQEQLAFRLGHRAAAVASGGRRPAPLVRPQSECLTGSVFGSQRCSWSQLREAVERIADSGGFLLYLRQDGFGVTVAARVPTGMHLSDANARSGPRRREGSRVRSTSRSQRGEIALC